VGFVLDPMRPLTTDIRLDAQRKTKRPVVGLNISGLLYMGGYSRDNMFDLKLNYAALIPDLLDAMIAKNGTTVVLIPHVFGVDGESDSTVCQAVYATFKERYGERLLIADGHYNQSEIKYVIGQCDFFIGSRMHACIAALSQNVPTVSIAYSRKFIGVMQTIGVPDLVADPRMPGKEDIMKLIEKVFEQKTRIRQHLEKTMPHVKETVLNLFDEIASGSMGVPTCAYATSRM
jgi:colanic acid/amylovoran biosynthesis protein